MPRGVKGSGPHSKYNADGTLKTAERPQIVEPAGKLEETTVVLDIDTKETVARIARTPKAAIADLEQRFSHHPPSGPEVADQHADARKRTLSLAKHFAKALPEGREKSLVITKLEEALFWANAAIARNQ